MRDTICVRKVTQERQEFTVVPGLATLVCTCSELLTKIYISLDSHGTTHMLILLSFRNLCVFDAVGWTRQSLQFTVVSGFQHFSVFTSSKLRASQ
jgi:hypothetical protein